MKVPRPGLTREGTQSMWISFTARDRGKMYFFRHLLQVAFFTSALFIFNSCNVGDVLRSFPFFFLVERIPLLFRIIMSPARAFKPLVYHPLSVSSRSFERRRLQSLHQPVWPPTPPRKESSPLPAAPSCLGRGSSGVRTSRLRRKRTRSGSHRRRLAHVPPPFGEARAPAPSSPRTCAEPRRLPGGRKMLGLHGCQ